MPTTHFDEREFRNALGCFPTGVAIITADVDGTLLGNTISSFNSVSLKPPLVLFSLARSAFGLSLWQKADHFGIILLREDQDSLSTRFARSGIDKWIGFDGQRMANGAPLLPGWLAHFECETHARYDGGDHEIFIGRVHTFHRAAPVDRPLVFYNGKYSSLNRDTIPTPADTEAGLHGW